MLLEIADQISRMADPQSLPTALPKKHLRRRWRIVRLFRQAPHKNPHDVHVFKKTHDIHTGSREFHM